VETIHTGLKRPVTIALDEINNRLLIADYKSKYLFQMDCKSRLLQKTNLRVEGATSIAVFTKTETQSNIQVNNHDEKHSLASEREEKMHTKEDKSTIIMVTKNNRNRLMHRIWCLNEKLKQPRIANIVAGVERPVIMCCDSKGDCYVSHHDFAFVKTSEIITSVQKEAKKVETPKDQASRIAKQNSNSKKKWNLRSAIVDSKNDDLLYVIYGGGELYSENFTSKKERKGCPPLHYNSVKVDWQFDKIAIGQLSGLLYVVRNVFEYGAIYRLDFKTGHLVHIAGYLPYKKHKMVGCRRDGAGCLAQFGVISSIVVNEQKGKVYVCDAINYSASEARHLSRKQHRLVEITIPSCFL
jgi:hypothetical protein